LGKTEFLYLYTALSLSGLRNFGKAQDHGYGAKMEEDCHQQKLSYCPNLTSLFCLWGIAKRLSKQVGTYGCF